MIRDDLAGHVEGVAPTLSMPRDAPDVTPLQAPPGTATTDDLRALVDAHLGFVWRSLRRLGLSPADADDAAQRVFLVASRKLSQIEAGKEKAFLFGIATRTARDARRAAGRRPESPTDELEAVDSSPNPEELTDRRRARAMLDEVLESMPEEIRTPFVLFELEGLGRDEIAALLEIPSGTVASRVRRGRELFQSEAARLRARLAFRGGA
jgi:RNA polymerase sigma-70 factor (ECF subfamily)